MKLSVIIVNYNVQHFLEQCLYSVREAASRVPTEVWVVDNSSVDGSVAMVREKFPEVKVIANTDNPGFSKGNNQAIEQATGEYMLLLNPDTVVEEDTFEKVVRFMDEHPNAGGLGVKMIDGKGNFLPESKRGLPTPDVAFYKIFGLSRLFPKSKRFGRYHLGYLSEEETHEVDVLSGAFMLLRTSVLDKIGLLDEAFFMYGEDIDLSYRITQAGYKNYYFPDTRIIHYKGESTKKSSINYVFVFYRAMVIFAQKHFSEKNAQLFGTLINIAIWFRASIAVGSRVATRLFLPALDILLMLGGLFLTNYGYEVWKDWEHPRSLMLVAFPAYALVWVASVWLNGGYDKPVRLPRIAAGILIGTGVILVGYALLPESYRFSRAIILLGTVWSLGTVLFARYLLSLSKAEDFALGTQTNSRFAIVGEGEEISRVEALLRQINFDPQLVVHVSSNDAYIKAQPGFVAPLSRLQEVLDVFRIHEVIFCSSNITRQEIIRQMSVLQRPQVDYKIAPPESLFIIGSNSINTSGDLYMLDVTSIGKPANRRKKRLFDVVSALLMLVASPLLAWFTQKPGGFVGNCLRVLSGSASWVGYAENDRKGLSLPDLKPGIITPATGRGATDHDMGRRLNVDYARKYNVGNDVNLLVRCFAHLGN